jgi:uncharacterized membrane protein
VIALAAAASVVILVFRASVTNMIPLYALGVFTSFTLSQTGMARRHLRLREKGWKLGLAINGLGAVSTFVVAIVIGVVKFRSGAWIVVAAVPLLVALLLRVNRTYVTEEKDLLEGLGAIERPLPRRHLAVLVVDELDEKTFHALQYSLTIQPEEIRAVHLLEHGEKPGRLAKAWEELALPVTLEEISCPHRMRQLRLADYVRSHADGETQVTVIVPGPARLSFWQRLRRGRSWSGLSTPLRGLSNVSVAVIRDHGGRGHKVVRGRLNVSPRQRHVAIIPVGRLDRSVLKAIRYARAVEAIDIRAVHAASDPEYAGRLAEQWAEVGHRLGIPLDLVECSDRNIARTVVEYVDSVTAPEAEVTVVLPRREYSRWAHRLLHDQTSRSISMAVQEQPHVDVVVVPYRLGDHRAPQKG